VFYQVSDFYFSEAYMGLRWNDPAFGINWPLSEERVILQRDESYSYFKL